MPALVPPLAPSPAPGEVPGPASPSGAAAVVPPAAPKGGTPAAPDSELLLAVYGRLFGVLPRVGAAVIALASLGYFLGWQNARAYYGAFGADWIVGLLSTPELLQRAYGPLLTVCGGLLLGVVDTTTGNWSIKAIRRVQAVAGIVGSVLLFAPQFGGRHWSSPTSALLASLGGIGVSACLGMIVAQHARALRDQGLRWSVGQLPLVTSVWFFLITQLPQTSGGPEGRVAADARASTLAHVAIDGEDYRLVLAHADRLVVAKLRPGAPPVIRIVASDASKSIVSPPGR